MLFSKLIEKIVVAQLNAHLIANNILEKFQSAYKAFHSTESALLRVQNDLLRAVDTHGAAILVMLDLSAAFDTIDHATLLKALEFQCGITGTVLKWFGSYLSGRVQAVKIGSVLSAFLNLAFGVPQGSVLGPILFVLYTSPISSIVDRHGLKFHLYADDTQLYIAFKPKDPVSRTSAIASVEACANDLRAWMANNFLKLNDDKTELIIIKAKATKSEPFDITIGNDAIHPVLTEKDFPKNLGVYFDPNLSLDYNISKKVRSINSALFKIGRMRRYLDYKSCKILINTLMVSRLDYCNALLYGLPARAIQPLQRLQNRAARTLTLTPKFASISGVLRDLHWLPVEKRIVFKVLLFCYKAQHGLAPSYLSELLIPYTPSKDGLRPRPHDLVVPSSRLATYGDRCFEVAAPRLWNKLPLNIRTSESVPVFKQRLKTYLFTASL